MPHPAAMARDPLVSFLSDHVAPQRKIALLSAAIDVEIRHGMAMITTTRLFRNEADKSLEATLYFPLPVQAVLFSLEARIGERDLAAYAFRRACSSDTRKVVLELDRTAVFHEELLKGIHKLSAGVIAPGEEVEVVLRCATTLPIEGNRGRLRIPTTLGDVYARPPVPDFDMPVRALRGARADLHIQCVGGRVSLAGGDLNQGHAVVALDMPIDLEVADLVFETLTGLAAKNRAVRRAVRLTITPTETVSRPLDLALLVDRSGSMEAPADPETASTRHDIAMAALAALAVEMRPGDAVDAWQFSRYVDWIGRAAGETPGAMLQELLGEFDHPQGGTWSGSAIQKVIGAGYRDVLVVTDGMERSVGLYGLAGTGCRVTVLLIGEDSLSQDMPHLAALTGGDIFIANGTDIEQSLRATVAGLRRASSGPEADGSFRVTRHGADIDLSWGGGEAQNTPFGRAVAALAAHFLLPLLDGDEAEDLAVAEGLVSDETILVLLDKAQPVYERWMLARMSPEELARPPDRSAAWRDIRMARLEAEIHARRREPRRSYGYPGPFAVEREEHFPLTGDLLFDENLQAIGRKIDWAIAPRRLLDGDLSELEQDLAAILERLASDPRVTTEADRLSLTPILLAVGLVARAVSPGERSAAKVEKRLLGNQEVLGTEASSRPFSW